MRLRKSFLTMLTTVSGTKAELYQGIDPNNATMAFNITTGILEMYKLGGIVEIFERDLATEPEFPNRANYCEIWADGEKKSVIKTARSD